jgi:hypothetical protein
MFFNIRACTHWICLIGSRISTQISFKSHCFDIKDKCIVAYILQTQSHQVCTTPFLVCTYARVCQLSCELRSMYVTCVEYVRCFLEYVRHICDQFWSKIVCTRQAAEYVRPIKQVCTDMHVRAVCKKPCRRHEVCTSHQRKYVRQ